jgi:predicted phosphoribosyltransferase
MMIFNNRADAAHQLTKQLQEYKDKDDVVIITIPRGGLELGVVLAKELQAPLDIVLVKKIGAPWNSEMAIGAVSMNDMILNPTFDTPEIHDYINLEVKKLQDLLKVIWGVIRKFR